MHKELRRDLMLHIDKFHLTCTNKENYQSGESVVIGEYCTVHLIVNPIT